MDEPKSNMGYSLLLIYFEFSSTPLRILFKSISDRLIKTGSVIGPDTGWGFIISIQSQSSITQLCEPPEVPLEKLTG